MRTEFQSKDIQKMNGVQKQRVEYLSLRVPIRPEVAEVEGTGRAHIYSFKNAIQFAIAQEASNLGLYLAEIRSLLQTIEVLVREAHGYIDTDWPVYHSHFNHFYSSIYPGKKKKKKKEKNHYQGIYAMHDYYSEEATQKLYALLYKKQAPTETGGEVGGNVRNSMWIPVSDVQDIATFLQRNYGTIILNLAAIKQRVIQYATEGK
jgi:hypothetical protein